MGELFHKQGTATSKLSNAILSFWSRSKIQNVATLLFWFSVFADDSLFLQCDNSLRYIMPINVSSLYYAWDRNMSTAICVQIKLFKGGVTRMQSSRVLCTAKNE